MTENPFIGTRDSAAADTADGQGRNRLWWERMPMTYADWAAEDRMPKDAADLRTLPERALADGPWLSRWFAERSFDGQRVLDLGCGSGIFSTLLAKAGGTVTGVDLTETAVRLAGRTADSNGVSVTLARADAECLPFADGTFDYVYSWGVLHHTARMERAVAEAGRVLKRGGRGIVMVYHRASVVYWLHGLFWLTVRGKAFAGHTFRTVQDFYTDGFYHRYLTADELAAMLVAAGVRPERVTITQYRKKILPFVPRGLDEFLKARFGMCLVIEFEKAGSPAAGHRATDETAVPPKHRRTVAAFLWLWVAGVLVAYSNTFRDILPAILRVVGLDGWF